MLVPTISMWAQPIERDNLRFDFDRQLDEAELQYPEFITPITRSEATPAGGIALENQSSDKIRRIAPHAQAASSDGNVELGYVTQDKLRYSIFQFKDAQTPVATLIGWVDSYDYYPNVVIPDYVTYNGQPVPVTAINDYCFYGGWGITGVTIGRNVAYIGNYAFWECSITELSIPDVVTYIGNCAFCLSSLNSIVFENPSVYGPKLVIGVAAFCYTNIKSFEIPARLRLSDDYSFIKARLSIFEGCKYLESITINPMFDKAVDRNFTLEINQGSLCERIFADDNYPEYLKVIAYPAARECQDVSLTAPIIDVFMGAFSYSKINKITLTATSDPRTDNEQVLRNLYIGDYAFNYSDISILNLSANGPIGIRGAFALYCNNLSEYNLSRNITNMRIINGALCAKNKKDGEPYLVSYPAGRTETRYTVPEEILHLYTECFKSNIYIKEITLPVGLKSIGDEAFTNCKNLQSLFYTGNSLESIGVLAFDNTKVISSAPPGEVALGNWLIGYSGDVPSNLVISDNIAHSAPEVFSLNSNISSVTFPQNFENIPTGMFRDCTKLSTVHLPQNLKTIGDFAFKEAGYYLTPENSRSGELRTLTIPEGVTEIGRSAFFGSRLGDKLVLPLSLKLLGENSLGGYYSEVEIHRSTPPVNEEGVTQIFLPETLCYGTLIIPKDADPVAFTQNPYWDFWKVINGEFASLDEELIEQGKINVSFGTISSTNGESFTLYSADGRSIGHGSSFSDLNPGIYIVRLGDIVQKYIIP